MSTATKATDDQWSWWRAALAGTIGDVLENEPQSGFYRSRKLEPVAFWRAADGELQCLVLHRRVEPRSCVATWLKVAKQPVTKQDYDAHRNTGRWPDMPDERVLTNLPADPFEALLAEINDKIEQSNKFIADAGPVTKTRADMARNIQAQLLILSKQATAMHGAEKAPHMIASRAVDDKYRFREAVEELAKSLRNVFETFMRYEELRLQAEAQAKFEADRAAAVAEAARINAERAELMRVDPIAALTSPEPELPVIPLAPEPVKVMAGGGIGRRAGLRTEYRGVIDDHDLVLKHFRNHPDVKTLIIKLVNAAVRMSKGDPGIEGVSVTEERVAI